MCTPCIRYMNPVYIINILIYTMGPPRGTDRPGCVFSCS